MDQIILIGKINKITKYKNGNVLINIQRIIYPKWIKILCLKGASFPEGLKVGDSIKCEAFKNVYEECYLPSNGVLEITKELSCLKD